MTRPTKIGVVTTGHGPRDEYVFFHRNLLAHLGAGVEVTTRHVYEGLTLADITPHQVGKEVPNIGGHVHVPGATGNHMGDGWEHRFYALPFVMSRVQIAIDRLENEDGVDLVILACAAEMPKEDLRARTLLVHPRDLVLGFAGTLANSSSRKLRMGLIVDAEHAEHDRADWTLQPWFNKIDLYIAPVTGDISKAAAELGNQNIDYAFFFGYGVGLAPGNSKTMIMDLESKIGKPLILPHRVTTLFIRNLVLPTMDDNQYLPSDWRR